MMNKLFLITLTLALAPIVARAQTEPAAEARSLFQRLTGVPLLARDPRLREMTELIAAGKKRGAASLATDDDRFYDITVRGFAAVMSNKDETPHAPLNDFQAMIIGTVRDERDARELLTGDFTYRATEAFSRIAARDNDNQHYLDLEERRVSLRRALGRIEPQRPGFDQAAGVLTSRGWAEAHYNAGTNRRALEHTFRQFLCKPIAEWKQWGLPDYRVRRDIDRAPGGVPANYQGQCRSCHAPMDAMAGAFAHLDFTANAFRYYGHQRIAPKYNQNVDVYPDGYITIDDSWLNLATTGYNEEFGWRGKTSGEGPRAFGEMIAGSEAFSRCMVRRAFIQVCRRPPRAREEPLVRELGRAFESEGYNLKKLFEAVAVQDACASLELKGNRHVARIFDEENSAPPMCRRDRDSRR